MSREALLSRLRALEDARNAVARPGVLVLPDGLELDSAKGRAWLAVNAHGRPVAVVPARLSEDAWMARYGRVTA